jgi:hypothetical protein
MRVMAADGVFMRVRNASIHQGTGLMVSSFDLGRHGSRLLAFLSVVGLLAAMVVSTIG